MKRLSKYQVQEVLDYLDKGETNSKEIARSMGITKMQVAGVKAHRTMGKY